MNHQKSGWKLNRNPSHRKALYRSLTRALIEHERITTTEAKAKALRGYVEKIITKAKRGTLHDRRLVIQELGPVAKVDLLNKAGEFTGQTLLGKLFDEIGPRYASRPGGYTRVLKTHDRRLGDGGRMAMIELLKAGETKAKKAAPAAPAPVQS